MIRRDQIGHTIAANMRDRCTEITATLELDRKMRLPDAELHRGGQEAAEKLIGQTVEECRRQVWDTLYGELRSEVAKLLDIEKRTELDDRIKAIVGNLEFKG